MSGQCKSCMDQLNVTEEMIDEMLNQANIGKKRMVPKDVYIERLEKCKTCPSLMDGTTCMHCGCLVKYRARLIDNNCRNPSGSRWNVAKVFV